MALPKWMTGREEIEVKPGEKEIQIELKPEDIKAKFDGIETKVAKIDAIETGVNEMTTYIRQQKADREFAKQQQEEREAAAAAKKAGENTPSFEDDPEGALTAALSPVLKQNYLLSAKQTVRDLLDSGDFEFYTGPVKLQVDKFIEDQANRGVSVSQEFIQNAYAIAKVRHEKDIKEEKIKSRFAASSGAATGVGALNVDEKIKPKSLTDEEKHYAKAMGVTEEDYAKYREVEYV